MAPGLGLRVKPGDLASQFAYQVAGHGALLQPTLERGFARQPAHLDRVLDGLALPLQAEDVRLLGDRNHAQIHARRQSAVKLHLFVAEVATPLE